MIEILEEKIDQNILKQGIYSGQQDLNTFMHNIQLMLSHLVIQASELHGHVALVKPKTRPREATQLMGDDSDDSDYQEMLKIAKQNKVDVSNLFLVDIFSHQLVEMNKKLE